MVKNKGINFKNGFKRIAIALAIIWSIIVVFFCFTSIPDRPNIYDPDKFLAKSTNEGVSLEDIDAHIKYDSLPDIKSKSNNFVLVGKDSTVGSPLPLYNYIQIVLKHFFKYLLILFIGNSFIFGIFFLFFWIIEGFKNN